MRATAKQEVPEGLPVGPKAAQVVPDVIKQADLARLLYLRACKTELDTLESEIKAAVEANKPTEPGTYGAFINITLRRVVAWKSVVARLKGETYCKRVSAGTKKTPIKHLEVTIEGKMVA